MIHLSEREYLQWLVSMMGPVPETASWHIFKKLMPYDRWQVYMNCDPELPTEEDFSQAELLRRLELN